MNQWGRAKAIETSYGGYRFRSRLEARYAVWLTTLGIEFFYEVEGFELGSMRYLPDFYLPKQDLFLEVKPLRPSEKEFLKAYRLHEQSGKPVCFGVGNPPGESVISVIASDGADGSGEVHVWEPTRWYYCQECDQYDLNHGDDRHVIVNGMTGASCKLCRCPPAARSFDDLMLLAAWVTAKRTRFERH